MNYTKPALTIPDQIERLETRGLIIPDKPSAEYHLSLLQHLAYIRNICAHHGRLWNKQMVVTTQLPRNKPAGLRQNLNLAQPKKLYNTLVLILHLLNTIDSSNTFKPQLTQLLTEHQINTSAMGFPTSWQ